MAYTVSVTALARNLSAYLNRVAFGGDRFVLLRGRRAVAELRPMPGGRSLGELPALLAGLPPLSVEEATTFGDDLVRARAELAASASDPPRPWDF